jgi:hypothetical protein
MSDQLDLLLDSVREMDPFDEGFVQNVMTEVRADEARLVRKLARRGLRRPMVMGVAAAVIVTGGAVAAVVGTNPSQDKPATSTRPAVPVVAEDERATTAPRAVAPIAPVSDAASPAATKVPSGKGFLTDHTSFIADAKTGLLLKTESYTNGFTVGKPQRVTLTLENTGRYPVAFNASDGCALQVMAYGADEGAAEPDASLITDPEGKFEWVCAGSDEDPRVQTVGDSWVLAPGERKVADAFVVLPEKGAWWLSGMCRCEYKQVKPTPMPKADPLTDLTRRALPSPLLPEEPDGKNLVAPPIGVRAD